MKSYINLGSFNLTGLSSLSKFSLSKIPKLQNWHLSSLQFKISISGTASAPVSKADFLQNLIQKFNLYKNNKIVVDNGNGQILHFWGIASTLARVNNSRIPEISVPGTYNVDYYFNYDFANFFMSNPYDFCPAISDIESLDFEILLGNIAALGATPSINMRVFAEIIQRENEYLVPDLIMRAVTITKPISDIIRVPNRTLFCGWFLPVSGTLGDNLTIRCKNRIIADNLTFTDISLIGRPYFPFDDINVTDYNYKIFVFPVNSDMSIKKPLFFENEEIFYDNMSPANSPFVHSTIEIVPNDAIGTDREFDSRYSPIKK